MHIHALMDGGLSKRTQAIPGNQELGAPNITSRSNRIDRAPPIGGGRIEVMQGKPYGQIFDEPIRRERSAKQIFATIEPASTAVNIRRGVWSPGGSSEKYDIRRYLAGHASEATQRIVDSISAHEAARTGVWTRFGSLSRIPRRAFPGAVLRWPPFFAKNAKTSSANCRSICDPEQDVCRRRKRPRAQGASGAARLTKKTANPRIGIGENRRRESTNQRSRPRRRTVPIGLQTQSARALAAVTTATTARTE